MKILLLHVDYIKFKPLKKAIKSIKELDEKSKKEKEVKEALVVMIAVEKSDEANKDKIIDLLIENIKDVATQVKAFKIVLYPYAHLSSSLSNPDFAEGVLIEAEKKLGNKYEVVRAPFGYYKEFELKCKGHPLAELSREINVEGKTGIKKNKEIKKEEKELTEKEIKNLLTQACQTKLDTSKLKDNDHRILGQKLELFMFNESAPGMPTWLPKGLKVYNELIKFWREMHEKEGYQEIASPLINKKELYQISGHWEHYKENMFIADMGDDEVYALKPMNCPNAMLVFKSKPRSYKELPLRLSDVDRLHRYEKSGVLNGLLRVRGFQQDDSHNFISEDMIESEYKSIFKICEKFYSLFGLKYSFRLSTRPEGFLGDIESWNRAESILKKIIKESGTKYEVLEGDGAFYGPKIDIDMEDSMGRKWQMGTLQLDFQLPKRFGLTYIDKNNKEKAPIVVHRVIYGSLERFIGILIEHLNGNFPTWLAPIQVMIVSFTDRNEKAVLKLREKLENEGIRVEVDVKSETVNNKVRNAELMKIPYIIVIGDKEEKNNTLAVRAHGKKPEFGIKVEKFLENIKKEIQERE